MKPGYLYIVIGLALCGAARAQSLPQRQDLEQMRLVAQSWLEQQSRNAPGPLSINVTPFDARLHLPACAQLQAYTPQGAKPWGKTLVGVRCMQPAWQAFTQAHVSVQVAYVSANSALAPGQILQAEHLSMQQGDLANLPPGVLTDMQQALGKQSSHSISAGQAISARQLRQPALIQHGQQVKLVASGAGFALQGEGRAVGGASLGGAVTVKLANGQQISGLAQAEGVVAVQF
ncbi:flagellar basal body P-ring formation chaperone FlgA [Massilia sp. W12]|uniref:flagellar basal body P-ring formation chaperone FlgA n=1 Tax=Massilia sp. W12 TaxID=3126507 RepID=UPI0030D19BF9